MGNSEKKKAKRAVDVKGSKKANIETKPLSYLGLSPMFSFRKYDANATWSIPKDGKPSIDGLFALLKSLCRATWGDIWKASGGKSRGTNSHYVPIEKLRKEARERADNIQLNESELFSWRYGGSTGRLWGIIEPDGVFHVIWFDPNHQVYPVNKK